MAFPPHFSLTNTANYSILAFTKGRFLALQLRNLIANYYLPCEILEKSYFLPIDFLMKRVLQFSLSPQNQMKSHWGGDEQNER
jgi:hypothetical protein